MIQRYESSFDAGAPTPPFDVRWVWSVVGAPPGATISVRPVDGERLEPGGWGDSLAPIALVVLVVGGLSALLALRRVRRKTRPAGTEPAEHP